VAKLSFEEFSRDSIMTIQEQIKKRKSRAETSKRTLVENALKSIEEKSIHYFTDEEWEGVSYAVTQAVDKAFDSGTRYQRDIDKIKDGMIGRPIFSDL
jgi:ABC-type Zn uptake system ZnuABC Zn-binding protein ZnuA